VSAPAATALAAWSRHLGCEREPAELLDELTAGSLPESFHATAAAAPDRPALAFDGETRSHGELDRAAARFGGLLREHGVERGDAVLLAAPSSVAMVEAYLGALRAGATVVLANPSYTEAELRHLAEDSHAVALIAGGEARERLRALAAALPGVRASLEVGAGQAGAEPLAAQPSDPGEAALLAYTSGTTGKPKAVPLTHANVLSSIRAAMLAWRFGADDVLVHSLPLFHQHGLGGLHATLLAGSRAVMAARFDPEALCRAIESEQGTVLFAVPAIYERLAGWAGIEQAELGSLRLLVSGSAPLSPALARRIESIAGRLPLERYGTTESGLDVSNLYDGPRKPGAVGLPLPGIELSLRDDRGRELADGEIGEIAVRGPQVFAGYRGDPEATAESFYEGGWFRTGDIGRIDPADGFLSITGRAKDLIISGGMNVYPREVELALEESDAVARAAVVGVPSKRWGEEVVAAVVPAPGAAVDQDSLLAFARERLAPYKRPKRVVVVDELPLNHMGKVLSAEVVKLVSP
jgi:malonyl-CoA/methylmalonyl-CoA synthetase